MADEGKHSRFAAAFSPPFVRAGMMVSDEVDGEGWRMATLPIGSVKQAAIEFLRLGADVEILDPPELRARMEEIVVGMTKLYGERDTRFRRSA